MFIAKGLGSQKNHPIWDVFFALKMALVKPCLCRKYADDIISTSLLQFFFLII